MKKLLFILLVAGFVASCTKSEDGLTDGSYSYDKADGLGISGGGGESGGGGGDTIQSGQITAGEWNDLANWDFWQNLGQEEGFSGMAQYWAIDLSSRISVNLKNNSSENIVDAKVELLNASNDVLWTAKTDNFGMAELFPLLSTNTNIEGLKIRVNEDVFTEIHDFTSGVNNLTINLSSPATKKCDIAFVVDATGSMGDELEFLKVELIDVIGRVKTANPGAILNLGSI